MDSSHGDLVKLSGINRQSAIERAKSDLSTRVNCLEVFQYSEVNLVMKSLGDPTGVVTAANRVIPRTTIDLISYSAYDAEFAASSLGSLKVRLHKALNYIEGKLPYKNVKGYPKRVFIGEFGYPMQGTSEDDQASMVREFLAAAIEWNVPYALYWQFYNNELDDQGRQRGFWLVDDHNHKVKSYHLIKTYLGKMNHFLNTHTSQFGTYPTQEATNKQALDFLK